MSNRVYENYKYVIQDVSQLYVGAKYSFQELVESEEIPFKFRLVVERYIYSELDKDTSLESYFYYLDDKNMSFRIFKQLKTKVKINITENNKYITQVVPIEKFTKMSPQEKESQGVVIQEIIVNKLSLMSF